MGNKKLLGERLRLAREARHITQREMGAWVGASAKTVSLLEAGKRTISAAVAYVLAKKLGVTMDYLLDEAAGEQIPRRPMARTGGGCVSFELPRRCAGAAA